MENFGTYLGYFLVGLICIAFVYIIFIFLYTLFPHFRRGKGTLSRDASIMDYKIRTVEYLRNGTKIESTVCFSDGSSYIFYLPYRINRYMTAEEYLTQDRREAITEKAEAAHRKACGEA